MPNTKADDLLDDLRTELAKLELRVMRDATVPRDRFTKISCAIGRVCKEVDELAKVIDGETI